MADHVAIAQADHDFHKLDPFFLGGLAFRQRRLKRRMTTKLISERLGCRLKHVEDFEMGRRSGIPMRVLSALVAKNVKWTLQDYNTR